MTTEYRRQLQLRGTTVDWSSNNIALLQGEIGFEMLSTGWRMKVGNCTATWSLLPYIGEKDQAARDHNTLQDTEISDLEDRVTAIEGTATDLTALQLQVDTNTSDISGKQASLGSASSEGNITFWNGVAWTPTSMTLLMGGMYYWNPTLADYVAIPVGTTGQVLMWDTSGVPKWKPIPPTGGGVPEAPIDGELYARKDALWEIIASGGVAEAPIDGTSYVRKDAAWESLPASAGDVINATITLTGGATVEDAFNTAASNVSDNSVTTVVWNGTKTYHYVGLPGRLGITSAVAGDFTQLGDLALGAGIPESPADGKTYGRKDNAWIELVAAYDLYFDFGPGALTANAERAMVLARAATIPADLVGARVSLTAGDASAPVLTLYEGATPRATLTLTAVGGTWAPVVAGTPIALPAGALVRLTAPGTVAAASTGLRASVAAIRT